VSPLALLLPGTLLFLLIRPAPAAASAGWQQLDGERSLEYVRSRHDDPLSDFGRNQRQQRFVDALSRKILQPDRVSQFSQFMDIIKNNVRTNLSPAQILGLGQAVVSVGKGHVQGYVVGPGYVREPSLREQGTLGAVLIPDNAAIAKLVKALQDGTPPPSVTPSPSAS